MSDDSTTSRARLTLDDIEAGALAASQRWWQRSTEDGRPGVRTVCGFRLVAVMHDGTAADAQHIANMDPAETLALVAEVRRLRALASEGWETAVTTAKLAGFQVAEDYSRARLAEVAP